MLKERSVRENNISIVSGILKNKNKVLGRIMFK